MKHGSICCLCANSIIKRKKATTFFKTSFKSNLLLEVKWPIKAAANKPMFSSNAKGNSIRTSIFPSAWHALSMLASFTQLDMYQGGFCLAARGHAYSYYTAASGFLAEACKYQKGIICCECRHTPGSTCQSATLANGPCPRLTSDPYNLRRGPVEWLPSQRIHLKGLRDSNSQHVTV